MKTSSICLFVIILVSFSIEISYSQEDVKPFTAKAFWFELNRADYRSIKAKEMDEKPLTSQEKKWLGQYEKYLSEYYEGLSEEEKNQYLNEKDQWYLEAGLSEFERTDQHAKQRDTELLLKHIGFSGISGLSYGLMLNSIFDYDEKVDVAVPTILAGGSMLYPVFSKQYDNINNNSLWLRMHGKIAGSIYGYLLGMSIYGDNLHDKYTYDADGTEHIEKGHRREALAMSLTSSVGLGYLGFYLGKNQNWTEGRVSLYQYYGYAVPALTASVIFATSEDRPRVYAINHLISAPLGYLVANEVSKLGDYTRGDVTAITGLTSIGAAYGFSFIVLAEVDNETAILLPALTAATSSFIGHCVYKDFHLTRPEGRRVNYAAIGGALIGIGFAALIEPENEGIYILLPSTTGLIGYSVLANYYKKNHNADLSIESKVKPLFNIHIYPENLVLSKLDTHGYIPPLVSASLQF